MRLFLQQYLFFSNEEVGQVEIVLFVYDLLLKSFQKSKEIRSKNLTILLHQLCKGSTL